jgi:hypothetical protein
VVQAGRGGVVADVPARRRQDQPPVGPAPGDTVVFALDLLEAEAAQHRVVQPVGRRDVGHGQAEVIEHGP